MREEAKKRRGELKKQVEKEVEERLRKADEEDEAKIKEAEAKLKEEATGKAKGEGKGSVPAKTSPRHILQGMSKEDWATAGQPRASKERAHEWFEDYKKKKGQRGGEQKWMQEQAEKAEAEAAAKAAAE